MKNWIFIILALSVSYALPASACEYAEPIACKRPSLALHKQSMGELKKRIKTYGSLLQKFSGLKKSDRKRKCSKTLEIENQMAFIEKYAKRNANQFCEEHVKVLVLQSESLIDHSSPEHKRIKNKKAKLQLIDSAMDVSEALVYYQKKHPFF